MNTSADIVIKGELTAVRSAADRVAYKDGGVWCRPFAHYYADCIRLWKNGLFTCYLLVNYLYPCDFFDYGKKEKRFTEIVEIGRWIERIKNHAT